MNDREPARGTVVGLLGPTGVGKTAVAVEVARSLGVRVISCDSMQVYAGFPVLTDQPSPEHRSRAPHALVGVIPPEEECSAAAYAELAAPLISEDLAASGWALIAGGTGLYLRTAVAPLALRPAGDPEVRARLEERAALGGGPDLHAELAVVDPAAAATIDPRNIRRVIRALEAVDTSGEAWSGRDDLWSPLYRHRTLVVGLVLDRQELYRRIDTRAGEIVRGAASEVEIFRRKHGREATTPGGPGIRSAIGYPELCRMLDDEQGVEETVEQVAAATRRYARRQLTWLRKLSDAVIIDVCERSAADLAGEIRELALSGEYTKESRYP